MALMLAPYNSAMRIGMGFNSFTQSLCINDVVQKPDGTRASESDLRVKPLSGAPSDTSGPRANNDLGASSGTQVIQRSDGQDTISQVVTWEAKFVDKISEVTDSMNISGSLAIKVDALGGGGKAEGHFIDTNKFKESDINYFIQVKVTNQKLVADDVTQFVPIKNVQPNQFKDVYGDSFISGFLEGGVFSALISVKLSDKSKHRDFGGGLAVKLDFKVVQVEGEAKGGKTTDDASTDSETTISVSWSGGGDIKPDSIKDWNMNTLKQVAMEFPDRVARCPQRTSAILTKYTALRSYYEQSIKGSPLDYENAGAYSSALLDAYLDYKSMWKTIQTKTWEVEQDLAALEQRKSDDDLTRFQTLSKADYQKRLDKYNEAKTHEKENGSDKDLVVVKSGAQQQQLQQYHHQSSLADEEPLPSNAIVPYKNTVFGLDEARRDCRFEMIKITREVDAVTNDPHVASDPGRDWAYLSPVIFRQLIPKTIVLPPPPTREEMAKAKQDIVDLQKTNDDTNSKLSAANAACDSEKAQVTSLTSELNTTKANAEKMKADLLAAGQGNEAVAAAAVKRQQEDEKLAKDLADSHGKITELQQQMSREIQSRDEKQRKTEEDMKREIQSRDEKIRKTDEDSRKQIDQLTHQRDDMSHQKDEMARQKDEAVSKASAGQAGPIKINDVIFHSVLYGGEQQRNPQILQKLFELVKNQHPFRFDNGFFGHDPLPGVGKSGAVIYGYNNPGDQRILIGREGGEVRFTN